MQGHVFFFFWHLYQKILNTDVDLVDDDDQIEDPDYQPTQAEETGTLLLNPWMRRRLPQQAHLLHCCPVRRTEKGKTP